MNANQKQRAKDALQKWHSSNDDSLREYQSAELMAALLQELVDAPEPEPFGYFKSEPFGWTDCAETDDGAIALYTAPPAPSVLDGWRSAIAKEFPLYDEGEIDEDKHCCEWVMLQERKRLHKILAAPTPAEAPADVARDARLQVESEFAALLPGVVYMDEPDGGSPTVQEQIKRMARDAARYRWLLNQAWFQQAADRFDFTDGGMQNRFEKCMDEFIDAAMSEKGQS